VIPPPSAVVFDGVVTDPSSRFLSSTEIVVLFTVVVVPSTVKFPVRTMFPVTLAFPVTVSDPPTEAFPLIVTLLRVPTLVRLDVVTLDESVVPTTPFAAALIAQVFELKCAKRLSIAVIAAFSTVPQPVSPLSGTGVPSINVVIFFS
jgi:hypothetical protein